MVRQSNTNVEIRSALLLIMLWIWCSMQCGFHIPFSSVVNANMRDTLVTVFVDYHCIVKSTYSSDGPVYARSESREVRNGDEVILGRC